VPLVEGVMESVPPASTTLEAGTPDTFGGVFTASPFHAVRPYSASLGMHGILVEHPAPAMAELRRLAGLR